MAAAQHLWDSILTKCGDSYFYYNGFGIDQFRQPSFRLLERRLTDADRMNGIGWAGEAIVTTRLATSVTPRWEGERKIWGTWGSWKSGEMGLHDRPGLFDPIRVDDEVKSFWIVKINGEWHFSKNGWDFSDPTPRPEREVNLEMASNARMSCRGDDLAIPPVPVKGIQFGGEVLVVDAAKIGVRFVELTKPEMDQVRGSGTLPFFSITLPTRPFQGQVTCAGKASIGCRPEPSFGPSCGALSRWKQLSSIQIREGLWRVSIFEKARLGKARPATVSSSSRMLRNT
jgi:hypothetical protein